MDQIIRYLRNSDHILVATHTHPDGDAIGSLIAMGLCLDGLNKKITLYNESPIPAVYRFLPGTNRVVRDIKNEDYDLAVILDCGNLQRIGTAVSAVRQIPVIVNIDHHVTNTGFGDFQLIDTLACATAATSIYTGILTDTGSFRFSNTNRAAFSICQEMVGLGVDPYSIAQHVYGTYSLGRIKLLNLALDSIEISDNGKLSMMTLTQDMLNETHTNYAKRIEDIKVAALILEHGNSKKKLNAFNRFHISLRSNGSVDVAAIAASFGGGGHSSAAGFSIESTLSDIKLQLLSMADNL
ncbi:MAG: DHH family phosphoesterase [Deltaproteobacteria bacterium]|nr:DHH family phosphoesterase [Deltaproteobacteria bacterium]